MNKLIFILPITILLGMHSAHASSTFSPTSTVTITIDSITNTTTPGDFSGLEIIGLFEIAGSGFGTGQAVTGDGNSPYNYTGGEIDSTATPVNIGDSISHSFSAFGNASDGSVDAFYLALGELSFENKSLTDSFSIGYSLSYDLNAIVSGDDATNTVALDYYNDLETIAGFKETSASTSQSLSNQNTNTPAGTSFVLNLASLEKDKFYADVSITGYAAAVAPVPLPAASWLLLTGLGFLGRYRKLAI